MIVVSIISLLATLVIPNFARARDTARTTTCIANLKQIDAAKQQWVMESMQSATATPVSSDLIGPAKYIKMIPLCPIDTQRTFATSYTIGSANVSPSCQKDTTAHTL